MGLILSDVDLLRSIVYIKSKNISSGSMFTKNIKLYQKCFCTIYIYELS